MRDENSSNFWGTLGEETCEKQWAQHLIPAKLSSE
jgi:hypothetical protein